MKGSIFRQPSPLPVGVSSGYVMTVLGPLPINEMGVTLMHEHILLDASGNWVPPCCCSDRHLAEMPVKMENLGELSLNLSGCMNSCGHHHVANIGILGVDKHNEEWYQVTLGGRQGNATTIGKVIGPSFAAEEIPDVIAALLDVYVEARTPEERFIDTFDRIGPEPFKARAYAGRDRRKTAALETAKEIA